MTTNSLTTSSRLTATQHRQLDENTKKFESAAGGDKYTPGPAENKLSQDLNAMEALFRQSLKG